MGSPLKLFVTLAALGAVIGGVVAVSFAYGERSAKESVEREMDKVIQQREAAQKAAELAEKERDKALTEKIVAEEAASLAKSEGLLALSAVAEVAQDQLAEEKAMILEVARTQPLLKAIVTGELRFYIEPLPSFAGEGVQQAVNEVARSFSSWSKYQAEVIRVYNLHDADLTIEWVRDYGSHVLGQAIFSSHIKVGLGTSNCVGEWQAFDASTIKRILWHELGHSMGYGAQQGFRQRDARDCGNSLRRRAERLRNVRRGLVLLLSYLRFRRVSLFV